jgi:lysine-N-methylase
MQKTNAVRPDYADSFRCIGSTCEDSCCAGWQVAIDEATYEKYQSVSPGPLRVLLDASVVRTSEDTGNKIPSAFARIKLLPSAECPFHNAERLCQIQVELGERFLSQTCATYPRRTFVIDKLADKTLTFSCPEACRLVLLNPDLFTSSTGAVHRMNWDDTKDDPTLVSYFWPIREFVVGLIRNRTYPLWQRMFLLGLFSRRLEAILRGEIKGGFLAMLKGFSEAIAQGSLRASIETLPTDLALQLGMVLELVKLRSSGTLLAPRLFECIDVFSKGIGHGPEATLQSMSTEYGAAYRLYFEPFFARHPYILENYLINMIYRRLFPFGNLMVEKPSERTATFEPAKEFALLATDFALIKGLLIGVAGAHKEDFSVEHVVQTVQSVSKYFEHNSEFVAKAHQILVDNRLDNANGLTLLLRN